MARKPNILFIMTDQQRADHVGFMGNGVVQTPHLDSLAASGGAVDGSDRRPGRNAGFNCRATP